MKTTRKSWRNNDQFILERIQRAKRRECTRFLIVTALLITSIIAFFIYVYSQ